MEQIPPPKSQQYLDELILKLKTRLQPRISVLWDDNLSKISFIESESGKAILEAQYGFPPYPNPDDSDTLVEQAISRLDAMNHLK